MTRDQALIKFYQIESLLPVARDETVPPIGRAAAARAILENAMLLLRCYVHQTDPPTDKAPAQVLRWAAWNRWIDFEHGLEAGELYTQASRCVHGKSVSSGTIRRFCRLAVKLWAEVSKHFRD